MNVWQKSIIDLEAVIAGLRERCEKAEAALLDASAQNSEYDFLNIELMQALEPFAKYMEGKDTDNNGKPLPDDQGVGWVYLTYRNFRAARAASAATGIKP